MIRILMILLLAMTIIVINANEADDELDIEIPEYTDYLDAYDNEIMLSEVYSAFNELQASTYDFKKEDAAANKIQNATYTFVKEDAAGENIISLIGKLDESAQIFADKRMLKYDSSIIVESAAVKAWKEIYKANSNTIISKVHTTEDFIGTRVIAEACVSNANYAVLDENIEYYKSRNYNAVLVTFDKDSTTYEVVELIKHIKSKNMKVWLAFTGKEDLSDSVFMGPDRYIDILKNAASYAEAYLLCWRRTSVHLWKQDDQFVNYTCTTLRQANPNIYIFGEYYYGETSDSNKKYVTTYLYSNFLTGMIITNYGTVGKNQQYVINKLKKLFNDCTFVGGVIGDIPGYLAENSNGKTYSENMDMKLKIERRFMKAGCYVTITNQNDGKHMIDNDITKTIYKNLNSK